MLNSFIAPRKKHIFRTDTKMWIGFVIVLLFFYIIIEALFSIIAIKHNYKEKGYIEEKTKLDAKSYILEEKIRLAKSQEALSKAVFAKNINIAQSIKDLFALIPESIYLNRVNIQKQKVTIKGHTPSKEVFNQFLLPPLKSTFEKTIVYFYPLKNGWFSFDVECFSKNGEFYDR